LKPTGLQSVLKYLQSKISTIKFDVCFLGSKTIGKYNLNSFFIILKMFINKFWDNFFSDKNQNQKSNQSNQLIFTMNILLIKSLQCRMEKLGVESS